MKMLPRRTGSRLRKFQQLAKEKHGDAYDYRDVQFKNRDTQVKIHCKKHDSFHLTPRRHAVEGIGCPSCTKEMRAAERARKRRVKSSDGFIERARSVHGDTYDYSNVEFINQMTPVEILCPKHGPFSQRPKYHLIGNGCTKCGIEKLSVMNAMTTEEFIEKARRRHGDTYCYEKSHYVRAGNKVTIRCVEHGEFEQAPESHIYGQGCPKCGKKKITGRPAMSTGTYVERARKKHGDRYGYEAVVYKGAREKVEITCHKHGPFKQEAYAHLRGSGCPACAGRKPK